MSVPTILYRSPGPFAGPPVDGKSTSYRTLGVSDMDALTAALADGWCLTLPEAVAPVVAPAPAIAAIAEAAKPVESYALVTDGEMVTVTLNVEPEAPQVVPAEDRAALEALAKDLGIKVDGRWSDETLAAKIAAAQK